MSYIYGLIYVIREFIEAIREHYDNYKEIQVRRLERKNEINRTLIPEKIKQLNAKADFYDSDEKLPTLWESILTRLQKANSEEEKGKLSDRISSNKTRRIEIKTRQINAQSVFIEDKKSLNIATSRLKNSIESRNRKINERRASHA